MKGLLYTILSLLLLTQTAVGGDTTDAQKLIKSMVDQVTMVLKDKDRDQEERKNRVLEIVTPMIDFSLMAKLSLGKKHWTGLSQEKRGRFSELFIKRLKESYCDKLSLYNDEEAIYDKPTQTEKKAQVPTYMISKGKKISMLYKLYKSKEGWKIYDTEIQGVSIIKTYRSQFDEILQSGTIDDLLNKLEKPEQA
jgi:phospholipid transport system substrate-binding protein